MDETTVYEFAVQVWFEDDEWNYSVVQEWESENSSDFEPLFYGTAATLKEATHAVSVFMSELDFED
jgi:hypothetical protein